MVNDLGEQPSPKIEPASSPELRPVASTPSTAGDSPTVPMVLTSDDRQEPRRRRHCPVEVAEELEHTRPRPPSPRAPAPNVGRDGRRGGGTGLTGERRWGSAARHRATRHRAHRRARRHPGLLTQRQRPGARRRRDGVSSERTGPTEPGQESAPTGVRDTSEPANTGRPRRRPRRLRRRVRQDPEVNPEGLELLKPQTHPLVLDPLPPTPQAGAPTGPRPTADARRSSRAPPRRRPSAYAGGSDGPVGDQVVRGRVGHLDGGPRRRVEAGRRRPAPRSAPAGCRGAAGEPVGGAVLAALALGDQHLDGRGRPERGSRPGDRRSSSATSRS